MACKHSIAGIVVSGSKVLIARRNPTGQMGGRWEFPGGKVEPGETDQQAVIREFDEEFGIQVVPGKLLASAEFRHNDDTVVLNAYEVSVPPENSDSSKWVLTEHTETAWVSFPEIRELPFVDSDLKIYGEIAAQYAETSK